MKTISFIFLFGIFCATSLAQDKVIKPTHLVESKGVVGFWQLVGELKVGERTDYIPFPNFKIYNVDGTFLVMRYIDVTQKSTNSGGPMIVTLYGTYKVEKDGKISEFIDGTLVNTKVTGTKSELEYTLEKENNILAIRYKLATSSEWVSEKWMRVFYKVPSKDENKNLQKIW